MQRAYIQLTGRNTAPDHIGANTMQNENTKPAAIVAPAKPDSPKPKRQPRIKPAAAPAIDKAAERLALASRITAERQTANDVFHKLSAAVSVPVKTLSAFKRSYNRDVQAHAIGRKPSPRQAAALYVAITAANVKLADNAKFPRIFTMRGASYAIENGALSDAIASGLCTYDSANETITLRNAAELQSQIKTAGFTI
jgi:hypothetical protein